MACIWCSTHLQTTQEVVAFVNKFLGAYLAKTSRSVFEIIGKSHYRGEKKDATFTLRHMVTECDMILATFFGFLKTSKQN